LSRAFSPDDISKHCQTGCSSIWIWQALSGAQ
jgi:hypothetical protein